MKAHTLLLNTSTPCSAQPFHIARTSHRTYCNELYLPSSSASVLYSKLLLLSPGSTSTITWQKRSALNRQINAAERAEPVTDAQQTLQKYTATGLFEACSRSAPVRCVFRRDHGRDVEGQSHAERPSRRPQPLNMNVVNTVILMGEDESTNVWFAASNAHQPSVTHMPFERGHSCFAQLSEATSCTISAIYPL